MKLPTALLISVLLLAFTASAMAQANGAIFGRAVDPSGGVLPGIRVTVAGPALIQPRVVITSGTGTYSMPELPVGTYSVTFEASGFQTLVRQDIAITIGLRVQVNAAMDLSNICDPNVVTGQVPLVDSRETGTKSVFSLDQLQNIPSARDPWVVLERTPGIAMDRANVGGSQSGQQSTYVSRGAGVDNNKWTIDGVDITDMSATGASPIYYDFDMLEEMLVTTGGADVTQQTGGVGINMVMKSGTDRFKGSARFYVTDELFQADNIDDAIRADGAGSGAPIQHIQDRGFEVGGPIKTGKAWIWGSYGAQNVEVGVVGFWKNDPACGPVRPTETKNVRACLETDLTVLNNYNWKIQYAPSTNNKATFQNTWAEKVRNARDASVTRPIETTYRQKAVSTEFGAFGWNTGPSPLWSARDQHVVNDRWVVEAAWAHLGNNFALDFHDVGLDEVQARFETSTSTWGRSFQASTFLRPTNSFDVKSYFFLQALGGDNDLRFGYRWRSAHNVSINHHGGFADARFSNGIANSADLWRDEYAESHLNTHAFHVQDTFTRNRLTLNAGVRLDRQDDRAIAATVPANPLIPAQLPAIDFPGADAGVVWTNLSPRLGVTYDLTGYGQTIVSASYAVYYGQMAPTQLSARLASTGAVFVRYPWTDRNRDEFVTANELDLNTVLSRSPEYDPANPTNFRTAVTVDPNIRNDRTREFIAGFGREIGATIAVGASYIRRKYDDFSWTDLTNWTSANYRSVAFAPTDCPADARCEPITYFEPATALPSAAVFTNIPDRWRDFNGFEVTFRKRHHTDRWSINASYAFNNAVDVFDSPASYEDPTCVVNQCPGRQIYAPEAGGSGIDNVFINARWLVKVSGTYDLPYGINLGANLNSRQGYPFPQAIRTPDRANSGGQADVHLDPLGEIRLPAFTQIDFRVDKRFVFRGVELKPTFDVFNVMNANTVLARRRLQASDVANDISGIVAPRVARFAIQVRW